MKPAPFDYAAPRTLDEALALLAEHGPDAKPLAGGQSLIPAMNFRVTAPGFLVDLNRVPGLDAIRLDKDGALHIGAMTRQRAVERDEQVARFSPLLHETMPHIAHPQIRNRGTIGGSLVHADPAAELPVIAVALGATLVLTSQSGQRVVPAADFFEGMFTVALQPGELLSEIVLPPLSPHTGTAFLEVARRHGDYAMLGLAARVQLDDAGKCRSAALVYLNAGDRPVSAPEAAGMLVGQPANPDLFAEAAEKASRDEIEPFGNMHASADFQRHLAAVLTRRALATAFERALS
jgi:carbon-monoxide dehydrogenase medium subunit